MPRLFSLPKRGAVSYADVTSANIVGFQNTTTKNASGYSFIIPTFVDVGNAEATYDLQNIKLIDADGSGMTDCIEVWTPEGTMGDDSYWWCTVDGAGVEKDGWYGYMGDGLIENVKLPLGTGLYLNLGGEDIQVQYAGQVYADETVTAELEGGYNIVGNSTPVEIDLQDIKLIDADGSGMTDCIEVWTPEGTMGDDSYWWCTVDGAGVEKDGWYGYMGDGLIENVKVAPGEALYFNLGADGLKVQLPNPMTYKAE